MPNPILKYNFSKLLNPYYIKDITSPSAPNHLALIPWTAGSVNARLPYKLGSPTENGNNVSLQHYRIMGGDGNGGRVLKLDLSKKKIYSIHIILDFDTSKGPFTFFFLHGDNDKYEMYFYYENKKITIEGRIDLDGNNKAVFDIEDGKYKSILLMAEKKDNSTDISLYLDYKSIEKKNIKKNVFSYPNITRGAMDVGSGKKRGFKGRMYKFEIYNQILSASDINNLKDILFNKYISHDIVLKPLIEISNSSVCNNYLFEDIINKLDHNFNGFITNNESLKTKGKAFTFHNSFSIEYEIKITEISNISSEKQNTWIGGLTFNNKYNTNITTQNKHLYEYGSLLLSIGIEKFKSPDDNDFTAISVKASQKQFKSPALNNTDELKKYMWDDFKIHIYQKYKINQNKYYKVKINYHNNKIEWYINGRLFATKVNEDFSKLNNISINYSLGNTVRIRNFKYTNLDDSREKVRCANEEYAKYNYNTKVTATNPISVVHNNIILEKIFSIPSNRVFKSGCEITNQADLATKNVFFTLHENFELSITLKKIKDFPTNIPWYNVFRLSNSYNLENKNKKGDILIGLFYKTVTKNFHISLDHYNITGRPHNVMNIEDKLGNEKTIKLKLTKKNYKLTITVNDIELSHSIDVSRLGEEKRVRLFLSDPFHESVFQEYFSLEEFTYKRIPNRIEEINDNVTSLKLEQRKIEFKQQREEIKVRKKEVEQKNQELKKQQVIEIQASELKSNRQNTISNHLQEMGKLAEYDPFDSSQAGYIGEELVDDYQKYNFMNCLQHIKNDATCKHIHQLKTFDYGEKKEVLQSQNRVDIITFQKGIELGPEDIINQNKNLQLHSEVLESLTEQINDNGLTNEQEYITGLELNKPIDYLIEPAYDEFSDIDPSSIFDKLKLKFKIKNKKIEILKNNISQGFITDNSNQQPIILKKDDRLVTFIDRTNHLNIQVLSVNNIKATFREKISGKFGEDINLFLKTNNKTVFNKVESMEQTNLVYPYDPFVTITQ